MAQCTCAVVLERPNHELRRPGSSFLSRETITPAGAPSGVTPFSPGVRVGNIVYVAGQVAGEAGPDIHVQTSGGVEENSGHNRNRRNLNERNRQMHGISHTPSRFWSDERGMEGHLPIKSTGPLNGNRRGARQARMCHCGQVHGAQVRRLCTAHNCLVGLRWSNSTQ